MMRRMLIGAGTAAVLLLAGATVAEATPATAKPLRLNTYTVSVLPPHDQVTECTYSGFDCGYIQVEATFGGLDRMSDRPSGARVELGGSTQVTRTYGCQNAAGKRLRQYDRVVNGTVVLGTRRALGFTIPDSGDTVTAWTYGFLSDAQPHNCPAGTTAMTYKIVAKQTRLEITSYGGPVPDRSYPAPARALWIGAVPAPAPAGQGQSHG